MPVVLFYRQRPRESFKGDSMRSLLILFVLFAAVQVQAAVEIAKVGGKSITVADIEKHLGVMPKAEKNRIISNEDTRKRLVENVITEELLVQEAKKRNIENDKDFQTVLMQTKRRLMAQKIIQDDVMSKMDEKNLKRHFDRNRRNYSTDEVKASHILLKTKKEADEVYKLATKKGANFGELAKKHSTDPTVSHNNGDLGFFSRGRMVPEFSEAAFKLGKGDISRPVKTQFGYHIIKVHAKKKGKAVKFEDVAARVRQDYQTSEIRSVIEKLKKKSDVSVNESNLKKLRF